MAYSFGTIPVMLVSLCDRTTEYNFVYSCHRKQDVLTIFPFTHFEVDSVIKHSARVKLGKTEASERVKHCLIQLGAISRLFCSLTAPYTVPNAIQFGAVKG